MALIKRLDRLDVAASDLAGAASTYENNFGFTVTRSADGSHATVTIGDAEIRLAGGAEVAAQIEKTGEGMFALWLEAENLDEVAAALRRAGIDPGAIRRDSGRRVIAVDPKSANQVPLYVFDRKS